MPIAFHSQIPGFRMPQRKKLVEWILLVAYLEKKNVSEVNYVFCTDEFLSQLNKKFLSHKTLTDIITFDYTLKKDNIVAEIYISIDRVKENARQFDVNFTDELNRVMIHGVLHCCGYSDKSEKERKKMRRKEDEYLKIFREMDSA